MLVNEQNSIENIAMRIKEMRGILGLSEVQMAQKTEITLDEYRKYESGKIDFPFTFLHKCTQIFKIDISDLLEGHSAKLKLYNITRKGQGENTVNEDDITIQNLAPMFSKKISEPYYVCYEYKEELQDKPIVLRTHSGQEFDFIIKGRLKIQIGDRIEYLNEGDSIYYDSSTPHGMIAVDGDKCIFIAVVLPGKNEKESVIRNTFLPSDKNKDKLICSHYIQAEEDKNGSLKNISFHYENTFNFAFDIVDEIANKYPDKLAMLHLDKEKKERRFTFKDLKNASNQTANYFKSLGIKKGDRVFIILKRHYQFWFTMLALHKIGAIAIPGTNQLLEKDIEYRLASAGVKAIICTQDDNIPERVENVENKCRSLEVKIIVGEKRDGWRNFNDEYMLFSNEFYRTQDTACGDDTMLMYFTSGTTGYPKIAEHSYKYPLAHFVTAKYWHGITSQSLHLTISDTGWGKAVWGKLYGQWLCEAAVFVYDFDRFNALEILPLFAKYKITTFCAPPTMFRMLIKEDISKYDFSSVVHMSTAGEALNTEVFKQFEKATGLKIMEGFGQTESTLITANLIGANYKVGSIGKPSPIYDVVLLSKDGVPVQTGETGEITIRTSKKIPCGLFKGYYNNRAATEEVWHDGYYHTRDLAYQDEDGFLWYVGRADDVIKSSGYRIGPFEIESLIMELPYVLECGVNAAPDPVRGQVVKASVVLVDGKKGDDDLVKEIQNYVKSRTAPYKYPRIVVFRDSLPKTISGKIIRHAL